MDRGEIIDHFRGESIEILFGGETEDFFAVVYSVFIDSPAACCPRIRPNTTSSSPVKPRNSPDSTTLILELAGERKLGIIRQG